jgi:hypothetical protein
MDKWFVKRWDSGEHLSLVSVYSMTRDNGKYSVKMLMSEVYIDGMPINEFLKWYKGD